MKAAWAVIGVKVIHPIRHPSTPQIPQSIKEVWDVSLKKSSTATANAQKLKDNIDAINAIKLSFDSTPQQIEEIGNIVGMYAKKNEKGNAIIIPDTILNQIQDSHLRTYAKEAGPYYSQLTNHIADSVKIGAKSDAEVKLKNALTTPITIDPPLHTPPAPKLMQRIKNRLGRGQ
jgi:hypothetical protein